MPGLGVRARRGVPRRLQDHLVMLLWHHIAGVEGAGGQTVSHDVHQRVISRSVRVIGSEPAGGFSHMILPEIVMIITISPLAERSMKPGVDDRQARLIKDMYAQSDLASSVSEGFRIRDDVYKSIFEEMTAANRGAVSPRGFELSARRIGRLMREQFNLGFVDVGGWDTHVNQGGATGYLADRLGELGRALAGFSEEIGPAGWRDTVVVVDL